MPMLSRRCTKNWPWFGGEINKKEGTGARVHVVCMYIYIHVKVSFGKIGKKISKLEIK